MKIKHTRQTWLVRSGKKAFRNEKNGNGDLITKRGNELYWLINNADTEIKTEKSKFWIVKDHPNFPKGSRIFDSKKAQRISKGGSLRPIVFPKDKLTMHMAREISKIMDLTMENQHGFSKGKNIYSALEPHRESKTFLLFDASSAFNTIEKNTVYYIFRNIFDLNAKDSEKLTDLATIDGYLYQGCPYAPAIWNIFQWHMMNSLNCIKDITVTSYADDLQISTNYETMSWSFRKALIRIIEDAGMKVNVTKTRFSHIRHNTNTMHRQLGLTIRPDGYIQPKHRASVKRTIKHLWNAFNKIDEKKEEQSKIDLAQVIQGWAAWFVSGESRPEWSITNQGMENPKQAI